MTPWTIACEASLSMEFSRQEYWSRLPFPSPGMGIIHQCKIKVKVSESRSVVSHSFPPHGLEWVAFPFSRGSSRVGVAARQCWGSYEETPHIQGQRRSPSKKAGGANLHLESNPIPDRDARRAQTSLVHTRTQGPHRDSQNCV